MSFPLSIWRQHDSARRELRVTPMPSGVEVAGTIALETEQDFVRHLKTITDAWLHYREIKAHGQDQDPPSGDQAPR